MGGMPNQLCTGPNTQHHRSAGCGDVEICVYIYIPIHMQAFSVMWGCGDVYIVYIYIIRLVRFMVSAAEGLLDFRESRPQSKGIRNQRRQGTLRTDKL